RASENPDLKRWLDENEASPAKIQPIVRRFIQGLNHHYYRPTSDFFRRIFGLQSGVSFTMYTNDKTGYRRPLHRQILELSMGAALGLVAGSLTYAANIEKPELHAFDAAITAGMLQFAWSYVERAN